MAIQVVQAITRYIGTAAEVAAFPLAGVPVGSTFFESDTGILKTVNAAGALVNAPGESIALSGSIPEYGWFTGQTPSMPGDPTKLAFGLEFDPVTRKTRMLIWDGNEWVEEVD